MPRLFNHIIRFWPPICAAISAIATLALLWYVRDTPLEFGANLRVDALSAFFSLVVLSDLALALARAPQPAFAARHIIAGIALLLVFATTFTPAIAVGYLVLAIVVSGRQPVVVPGRPFFSRAALLALGQRAVGAARWPLAAVCLSLGYGTLVLGGA